MAEALAKQRWPKCRIGSAGTKVFDDGPRATDKAIAVMLDYGLDISAHQTTRLSEINTEAFQFIVALGIKIRGELIEDYLIPETKIKNLFVDDPFDFETPQYEKCAAEIANGLSTLSF